MWGHIERWEGVPGGEKSSLGDLSTMVVRSACREARTPTCYSSACLVWSRGRCRGTEASLSQLQTGLHDGFLVFC